MTHRAIERERKRREAVSRWSASVAAATCLYRTLVRYNINIVRYRRGGLSLVYCRDCKRSVDDCEHFVAPIGSPHVTVFDPKVQSLAYEKKSMILEVEFKNGQVWQLFGIKPEIYEELLHATLSSFLKFLAHRYRAAPVRRPTRRNRSHKRALSCLPAAND